jgi:5-methylcytosine-specific restriction endonuclease McrA
MLLLTKAEMIEKKNGYAVRSPSISLPLPSVIRLLKYYRVPYRMIELSRKNIIRRDNYRCQYCGKKTSTLTIDHVIPKSRGGTDTWDNLVAACVKCNNKKGNRTPSEANMPLLKKPRKPNHIMFLKQFMGTIDDSWRPFLFMD